MSETVTISKKEYNRLISLEGVVRTLLRKVSIPEKEKPVRKMTQAQMKKHFESKL